MKNLRHVSLAVVCAALVCSLNPVSGGGQPAPNTPISVEKPIPLPPLKAEVIGKEPSLEHVWIPGAWEREPDKWTWVAGHWEKPPILPARWVQGYWKYQENRYHWHPGHWAVAENGVIVNKPVSPPPSPVESVPPPPSTEVTWVPGHWDWNDQWTWVAGQYMPRPMPEATWVAGHWKQGLLGFWRWLPGHWEVK